MLTPVTAICVLLLTFCFQVPPCLGRIPEHRHDPARSAAASKPLPLPAPSPPAQPATSGRPAAPSGEKEANHSIKGKVTGLPLPRFVSLRADTVNMRVGPGLRYKIKWVYKRRDLPVEITREFKAWRYVQDADGIKGWMHQATLTQRRSLIVLAPRRALRGRPDPHAPPIAFLDPGVVGRLLRCDGGVPWCKVKVGSYRGWLPHSAFWGTLPNEVVHP